MSNKTVPLKDDEKTNIEVVMEEYRTLRAESLQTITNKYLILTFGLGSIGFVFHAGISKVVPNNIIITFLIFAIAIPLLSLIFLSLWLGETERMLRAGRYLTKIENEINEKFGEKILNWETSLREKKGHKQKTGQIIYPNQIVISLFLGISYFSPLYYFLNCKINNLMFIFVILIYLIIFCVSIKVYEKRKEFLE
jgi:Flp pilus assembly protein TadB